MPAPQEVLWQEHEAQLRHHAGFVPQLGLDAAASGAGAQYVRHGGEWREWRGVIQPGGDIYHSLLRVLSYACVLHLSLQAKQLYDSGNWSASAYSAYQATFGKHQLRQYQYMWLVFLVPPLIMICPNPLLYFPLPPPASAGSNN